MADIWTLGFTTGKHASACLLKNSEVIFHTTEETLSGIEHDSRPFLLLLEVSKYTSRLDCVINVNDEGIDSMQADIYQHLLKKLGLFKSQKELNNYNFKPDRDKYLAASAIYKSNFKECAVLVQHENAWSLWIVKDFTYNKRLELKSSIIPKTEDIEKLTGLSNLLTVQANELDVSWGASQYMYHYFKWKNNYGN